MIGYIRYSTNGKNFIFVILFQPKKKTIMIIYPYRIIPIIQCFEIKRIENEQILFTYNSR